MAKNLPANAGDIRKVGSIPGLRRSAGGGHGNPLQYSFLENSLDRGAWQATVIGSQRVEHNRSDLAYPHVLCWLCSDELHGPTAVFLPGKSQGRQSLVGCRLWGRTESDTTEAT